MARLTKRVVDAAQPDPSGRQAIIWDSEVKGFGLRVTPAGARSYILNYRNAAGRDRRYTIGRHGSPWTCEEARSKAIELLRGLAAGDDPLDGKADARAVTTVADLVTLYLDEGPAEKPNKKASSWQTDRSNLTRHVVPLLGRKPIKSLTTSDVMRFQADVAGGKTSADEKTGHKGRAIVTGGKGVAARATTVLAAMLQFAVARKLLPSNPSSGVKVYKGEKMERFLVDREVVMVADALREMEEDGSLSGSMANAIRLLLLTGCRKGEIRDLRWEWVDFDRACLRLPDSKTGAKVVPLAAAALEILASLPRISPYVLPSPRSSGPIVGLQKAWERVRVRATAIAQQRATEAGEGPESAPDLTKARIHDLRHSFASFAVADGATLFMVGKVLGHKQTRTTEIYAHLGDDPLRAVADRTASRIADAMRVGEGRSRAAVVPLPRRSR